LIVGFFDTEKGVKQYIKMTEDLKKIRKSDFEMPYLETYTEMEEMIQSMPF